MITILHNNRCGKSRTALQYLESKGDVIAVRNYLENPLSEVEIEVLLEKLDGSINDIIRKNEDIWKDKFSETTYSDSELISILANNPKLLQRPIVITDGKAIVARDIEKLEKFLHK